MMSNSAFGFTAQLPLRSGGAGDLAPQPHAVWENAMKVWQIQDAYGLENLRLTDKPDPTPGPGQIVVAMKAASLNYRDLATVKGYSANPLPLIPFSDGAGEVIAVGEGVNRVKLGDRVCPSFFQSWLSGPVTGKSRS